MKAKKSKIISILLCSVMILALLPTVAFAEGTSVAWIGETGYETLEAAVNAATSGDTITLGEGKYTLHGKNAITTEKNLTFVGAGTDKTVWLIGPKVPDPEKFGTEYNSDYSFDGRGTNMIETVTFKNMTLQCGSVDYLGFAGSDITIVEDCVIDGKTFYWGYTSAEFKNTTFNAPEGDYAIWTYSSPTMTFDHCTFNVSGKAINVYTDYSAGKHDITVNYKDCIVNGNTPEGKKDKAVMNINDSNMGDYKYIINISGNNTVNGVTPDNLNEEYLKEQKDITCSRLFEFNTKYGNGNSGRTVVSIDGIKVWENGNMIAHEIDTANDSYTDGYKDDAYTITISDWEKTDDDYYIRVVKKVCDYCGYTSEYKEKGYSVTYTDGVDNVEIFKDQTTIVLADDVTPVFDGGTPTRDGYIFDGWNPDVNETVTKSITYTAAWKEEVVPTDPTTPPDPTRPTETNPDTGVTETNPDTGVTKTNPDTGVTNPQTGDNSNMLLWVALLVVSGAGVIGTTVYSKRKRVR